MSHSIAEIVQEIRQNFDCVTTKEALEQLSDNNGIIVDVREPDEITAKPAPLSINIPRGIIEMKVSSAYPDLDTPIYLHCASGARASFAAEQLDRIGYSNVTIITDTIDLVCACQDNHKQ